MISSKVNSNKAIVLLSGGLDSAAQIAYELEKNRALPFALHVNYGQKAQASEWKATQAICHYYGVELQKIELPWLGQLGGSSLTEINNEVPKVDQKDLDNLDVIEKTAKKVWVPNRNGILISLASALAERVGASRVLVGFNKEEATTFPDNSFDFMKAMSASLKYSTSNQVKVDSYTVEMTKTEMAVELCSFKKAFCWDLLWSCYHQGDYPCGVCESCQRLSRAKNVAKAN